MTPPAEPREREHLFFDLDGTLMDSQEGITGSLRSCLKEMGKPVPDSKFLSSLIGVSLKEAFSSLLQSQDEDEILRAVTLYRRFHDEGGGLTRAHFYPGALELLASLRDSGKSLYLATHKIQPIVEKVCAHFKIRHMFVEVFGGDGGGRENKTDILRRALAARGLDRSSAVMIGDRDQDILAAKGCGVASVAVTYGYGSPEELKATSPDFTCSSAAELAACLLR